MMQHHQNLRVDILFSIKAKIIEKTQLIEISEYFEIIFNAE